MKTAIFNNLLTANGGIDKVAKIISHSLGVIYFTEDNNRPDLSIDGDNIKMTGKMRFSYIPKDIANGKIGLEQYREEERETITFIDISDIAAITFMK